MKFRAGSYALAAACVAAGLLVVMLLQAEFARPFLPVLFVAVMLSAWLGGSGPGIFASALTLLIFVFLQPPRFQFGVTSLADGVQLLVFISAATLLAVLIKGRDTARLDAQKATHLALHDPLTGLPNRLLLNDRLEHAIDSARRDRASVSILMLDLDDFKLVNDSHGHGVGDAVLRQIADRLHSCVRSSDTIARLGGDEFVVVLPHGSSPDPATVAQRLTSALSLPFPTPEGEARVSVSIGMATYPIDGQDPQTLLAFADRAMYAAKQQRIDGSEGSPAE